MNQITIGTSIKGQTNSPVCKKCRKPLDSDPHRDLSDALNFLSSLSSSYNKNSIQSYTRDANICFSCRMNSL